MVEPASATETPGRPKMGIFGLTGCAGDQLAILDCEDELLELCELVDLRDFLMASSQNDEECALDVALVEGVVASRRDEEALRRIRSRSRLLVALGTCAVWGGLAAMDRRFDREELLRELYGEAVEGYDAAPARPLHEVVEVDLAITGCPVEKGEVITALASLLRGDPPLAASYPVCAECKAREVACLLSRPGVICCGAVTAAGCNARCPALGLPCAGCRGPSRDANFAAAVDLFVRRGALPAAVARKLSTFAPIGVSGARGAR
jgi:coenzyme F420-reducing hydrogenase gamma subunit